MAQNIREISTEAFAYLGDSVIELKVRKHLVDKGLSHSGTLNREAQRFVKASSQAAAMQKILPLLDAEEEAIFKRGRNMSGGNIPKSSSAAEYRAATGMEVLFGYLHLCERYERIDELFTAAFDITE
ncbi:MAG: ribonuclease III [Clostridia bacterium]|nr:ribonuclease III [Clostridia bacterium]